MTWIVESPWPSLTLGLVLEMILAIYLVRSGRTIVIAAMVLVLAVTAGMIVLERYVVTEAEAVEDALDGAAAALVADDPPRVLALFSPTSPRRAEVQGILSHVTVREARIGGDLEIHFNDLASPPTAEAVFTGRIDARDNRGQIPYEHMLGRFRVTLRREGGRWLIFDYTQVDVGSTRASGPAGRPRGP